MKHLGRAALLACICALCMLLLPALVQQTNTAPAEEHARELPPVSAVVQRCMMPPDVPAPQMPQPEHERYAAAAVMACTVQTYGHMLCCDGNGWVITGRTWPRTVYAVCPPEGMPG